MFLDFSFQSGTYVNSTLLYNHFVLSLFLSIIPKCLWSGYYLLATVLGVKVKQEQQRGGQCSLGACLSVEG